MYEAFRRYSVIRLQNTYSALPILEVARLTSPGPVDYQETEAYAISLVNSGHLKAELSRPREDDPKSTVLRFSPSGAQSSSAISEAQIRNELATQTEMLTKSLDYVQANGQKLGLSKEHIDFLRKQKMAKDVSTASGTNGFDIDEDMMADL